MLPTFSRFREFMPFALLLAGSLSDAAEPVFEVVAPEAIAFNYPDPPKEGAPAFFPIAEAGEPRCVIVEPSTVSPGGHAAVSAFARYLKLATGSKFRILPDTAEVPDGMAAIHVGDTVAGRAVPLDLPDLQYDDEHFPNVRGFLVKTVDPRNLVIRGDDETSTNHALVGFLKRYVGVRQYWPGTPGGPGDVIPQHPTLTVPELEWRDWPYFISLQMSMRPFGPDRPALDFYRREGTLPPGENYDEWLPPSLHVEAHPEYYALVNSERLKPKDSDGAKGWQPCVSNPGVRRAMGEAVLRYFRDHPEAPGINVSINDGGGDCTCAECRALDAPGTDYARGVGLSDRYVFLSNEICDFVGREFSDKWIVYLAYASAASPPVKVTPHPRLLPVLTTTSTFQRWDEWVKTGVRHLGHYVHHNDTVAVLPKMDVYQHARRIHYIVGSGKARTCYMEAHTQWPFGDLTPYITGELTWDPRRDVDALIDEYFSSFYGPAAEPMRDYYGVLREGYERWLEDEGIPHWYGKDISSYHQNKSMEQFRVLTPEEAARAAGHLEQAAKSAAGDEAAAERIGIIRGSFGLQKLAVERAWATFRLRDSRPESEEAARRMIEDARLVYQRSDDARRYIAEVLEQPPLDQWKLFRSSTKPLELYAELASGEPGPQVRSAVSNGLYATEAFLRRELGGEAAADWWRGQRETETVPALAQAFDAAGQRAPLPEPENLVSDPGFEEMAGELTGAPAAAPANLVLDPEQLKQAGIHLTFPDRSPYRCVLSTEEARSGKSSLMFEHCSRARFTRHVPAEPGARYRAGLWFRHNEGTVSKHTFYVDARLKDGSYQTLSTLDLPDEPGEWRQYVTEVVAPPGATTIFLRFSIERQAADARCWIDDAFIDR